MRPYLNHNVHLLPAHLNVVEGTAFKVSPRVFSPTVDNSYMQWGLWFGQIVAFVIGGGILGLLKLAAEREEYKMERERLDYRH